MSISDGSRVTCVAHVCRITNKCRYSVHIILLVLFDGTKNISTADLVRAGLVVVGCARREDKLASLATSLEGAKGKVVAGDRGGEK